MLQYCNIDPLFRALADGNRASMVEKLAASPRSLSSLASNYDMSLTAVGQHVKLLEQAGLVVTKKVGRTRICSVAPASIDRLERWAQMRKKAMERRLDRLEAYLAADTETSK